MSFVIVDAYGFLFRAYHSLPPLTNPKGQNIGAIYGMLNMLIKLINDQNPTHIVIALDSGRKNFRHEIFPQYKSNRPEPPDELKVQFGILKEMLEAMKLNFLSIEGVEADDIIASLSKKMASEGQESIIVSSDKDLMQLLATEHISMYDAMKSKFIGTPEVEKKFGIKPSQVLDYLALVGDSSDFVPGVRGIGAKTAENLIKQFNNLEGIYKNLEALTPRQRTLFEEGRESAFLSKKLISLKEDIPFNTSKIQESEFKGFKHKEFVQFLHNMGFHSVIKRLELNDIAANILAEDARTPPKREYMVCGIEDVNEKFIKQIYRDGTMFVTYIKPNAKTTESGIFYLSTHNLCAKFEVSNITGANLLSEQQNASSLKDILHALLKPLVDESIKVVMLNSRPLYQALQEYCGKQMENFDDLNVISYLLNCGKFKHEDTAVLEHYACQKFNSEELMYCYKELYQQLIDQKLLGFYLEVERKIPPLIYRMETLGVHIDQAALEQLSTEFSAELSKIEQKIYNATGEQFNIASPKQLGHILFEKMGLPSSKKSKTGSYVTNSEILEKLEEEGFEICRDILQFRHLSKLLNTYTRTLPKYLSNKDYRLHTQFQLTNTSTGRFSSQEPNLQNIPIRTEEGAKIRKAFSAKPGYVIVSADYSQIELRLLAHIANINALQNAINSGQDIHTATAREIFGSATDANSSEIRRQAKAINFGIIYGISAFGLAKRLGITTKAAKEYIDMYFQKFPGIKEYMNNTIELCRQRGYVETLFGRKCYITNINSKNHTLRSFSERACINAPLQGTAADIMKKAMVYLPKDVCKYLILQIHDELLFEVPEGEVEKISTQIKHTMETVAQLSVKLETEVKHATNWHGTK